MDAEIERKLERRIKRALQRVGIGATSVRIRQYSEVHFGNHTADVQTTDGSIEVIFDRKYEVDLLDSGIAAERMAEIQRSLNEEWEADARAEYGR